VSTGRDVAARVLARVLSEASWIAPTLDRALGQAKLEPREAARATDLVYGATRALFAIETEIDRHRPKKKPIEPFTRAVLATSVFELSSHADQAHAIVSSAVSIVRRERGEGLARFANAILRRVSASPPKLVPQLPRAIREVIVRGVGAERTRAIEATLAHTPALALRAEIDREQLAQNIQAARPGAEVRLGALSSRAVLVRGAGDPRGLPGYTDGAFGVQEEGSQLLAALVDARSADRIADVCAGHGGKTAVLARAVGSSGHVTALDLHQNKLDRIAPELRRLKIDTTLETRAADLTVGLAGLPPASFDRVLVDAPCTGLGTIARRPEILLRVKADDPARLAVTQRAILARAAELVRPGGRLVYAVCSPTAEEGAEVIHAFLAATPRASLVRLDTADADGMLRIGPWADPAGCADAYTAAVLSF
jgi:16S rRNA (cytosine967-C5)-methyltransferase